MSNQSFQIDIAEVRTAALSMRRAVDDLDAATRTLESAIQRVTGNHYGTDPLGRALQGESSGVGGLAHHQERVLQGIRRYLHNSSRVSDNLLLMCERYAQSDAEIAAGLQQINTGSTAEPAMLAARRPAETLSATPLRPRIGTVVTEAHLPDAPEHDSPPEPEMADYHDPDRPVLDYDDRRGAGHDRPERPGSGGGPHPVV